MDNTIRGDNMENKIDNIFISIIIIGLIVFLIYFLFSTVAPEVPADAIKI